VSILQRAMLLQKTRKAGQFIFLSPFSRFAFLEAMQAGCTDWWSMGTVKMMRFDISTMGTCEKHWLAGCLLGQWLSWKCGKNGFENWLRRR
jgi:hypothetical protein